MSAYWSTRWKSCPLGTLALTLAAGVALAWPEAGACAAGARAALAEGQVWRLWTAHLAHFSASHLLWSGLVWLAAGAWMEREDRGGWAWAVLVGGPLVTVAALAGDGEMATYGGLSGLACAPVAWAAWRLCGEADKGRRAAGCAVILLLAAKVVAELRGGGTVLAEFEAGAGNVKPAVWAHVAGALVGVAVAARRGIGLHGSRGLGGLAR